MTLGIDLATGELHFPDIFKLLGHPTYPSHLRSETKGGPTYYQFTIGDINVEGNVDPEEIRQKIEEGIERRAVKAITGTQGIIRREIDQNQLIDIGE